MPTFTNGLDPFRPGLLPASNAPVGEDAFSLAGRTITDPATITGPSVNIVFLGQSTNSNSIVGTYSPTYGANTFNLSLRHRGLLYVAAKPLLVGDITDDHHGRWLADLLIGNDDVDNVILTMAACGASYAADWVPGGGLYGTSDTRPGSLAYRIGEAARAIKASGLSSTMPRIIDWQQGEWDTDVATTQANYEAALRAVIMECLDTGLLRPALDVMFVHLCTRLTGGGARTAIRAAQAAVCDGTLVKQGADIDTLTGGTNRSDGTHFTTTGAAAQAALKATLYAAVL